jgi:hypothetical protein
VLTTGSKTILEFVLVNHCNSAKTEVEVSGLLINEQPEKQHMTKYRLNKDSGVLQATKDNSGSCR